MGADVDAACGAGYGERSPERVNRRNGYRERDWDTRVGYDRARRPQAPGGLVLPGLAAASRADGRRRPSWRWSPTRTWPASPPGASRTSCSTLGIEGSRRARSPSSRRARRDRRGLPQPAPRRGALPVRLAGRAGREVPGGRAYRERLRRAPSASTTTATASRSASTSSPPRTAPAGWRSCAAWSLVASRASSWSISDAHPGLVDAIAADPARRRLAAVPDALHPQPADPRPKSRPAVVATLVRTIFAQPDADSVSDQHARSSSSSRSASRRPATLLAEARRGAPRLHVVPEGALAPDLVEQPAGAAQQGDPPPHRRRRHLPEPRRRSSASSAPCSPSTTTSGPSSAAT